MKSKIYIVTEYVDFGCYENVVAFTSRELAEKYIKKTVDRLIENYDPFYKPKDDSFFKESLSERLRKWEEETRKDFNESYIVDEIELSDTEDKCV